MDARPFMHLAKPGYDIVAVWDYAAGALPVDPQLSDYEEIVVVAWSFGVRAASDFLDSTSLPVTRTIAVNGTEQHISDLKGIPEAIFRGTLNGLSENSVDKFRRRMCGGSAGYREFSKNAPQRNLDSLKAELLEFAAAKPREESRRWSQVIVSGRDMIFPAEAQNRAWSGQPNVCHWPEAPHFPDLAAVIDRFVIDKELVAERFSRASQTYSDNAGVQSRSARKLWDMLQNHLPHNASCGLVVEIGAGSGMLTQLYQDKLPIDRLLLWDIASISHAPLPSCAELRICDAESEINSLADNSADLILSASTLQWFNSPEHFVARASAKLKPGGVMALMFYAPGTFSQLAESTGMSLSYPAPEALTAEAAKAGLVVLDAVTDEETLKFDSPLDVLRHLKLTGVNALGRNGTAGHAARRLMRNYPPAADGSAELTYRPAYLLLTKPRIKPDTQNG